MKALEDENAKLKKLLAEQMLDAAALRVPAPVHPAAARGRTLGAQPHLPAVSRGRAHGAAAPGTAQGRGNTRPDLVEARPNARWSLDFVHDQFACGRRFRILNIMDDVTRDASGHPGYFDLRQARGAGARCAGSKP